MHNGCNSNLIRENCIMHTVPHKIYCNLIVVSNKTAYTTKVPEEGTDRVYGISLDFLEVPLSLKGRAHSTVQM